MFLRLFKRTYSSANVNVLINPSSLSNTLTLLDKNPSLIGISQLLQLLHAHQHQTLSIPKINTLYSLLLKNQDTQLQTPEYNSLIMHALSGIYYNNKSKHTYTFTRTIPPASLIDESTKQDDIKSASKLIDTFLDHMKELDVEKDSTTISLEMLALFAKGDLNEFYRKWELISEDVEGRSRQPLLELVYCLVIDTLVISYHDAIKNLKLTPSTNATTLEINENKLNKSALWKIYTVMRVSKVAPSLTFYTKFINAFSLLNDKKSFKKLHNTLTSLRGVAGTLLPYNRSEANEFMEKHMFDNVEAYHEKHWNTELLTAIINALVSCGHDYPEKIFDKSYHLIKIGNLQVDLPLLNATLAFRNHYGKPSSAIRASEKYLVRPTANPACKPCPTPDQRMQLFQLNLVPDYHTYTHLIQACSDLGSAHVFELIVLKRLALHIISQPDDEEITTGLLGYAIEVYEELYLSDPDTDLPKGKGIDSYAAEVWVKQFLAGQRKDWVYLNRWSLEKYKRRLKEEGVVMEFGKDFLKEVASKE